MHDDSCTNWRCAFSVRSLLSWRLSVLNSVLAPCGYRTPLKRPGKNLYGGLLLLSCSCLPVNKRVMAEAGKCFLLCVSRGLAIITLSLIVLFWRKGAHGACRGLLQNCQGQDSAREGRLLSVVFVESWASCECSREITNILCCRLGVCDSERRKRPPCVGGLIDDSCALRWISPPAKL